MVDMKESQETPALIPRSYVGEVSTWWQRWLPKTKNQNSSPGRFWFAKDPASQIFIPNLLYCPSLSHSAYTQAPNPFTGVLPNFVACLKLTLGSLRMHTTLVMST